MPNPPSGTRPPRGGWWARWGGDVAVILAWALAWLFLASECFTRN